MRWRIGLLGIAALFAVVVVVIAALRVRNPPVIAPAPTPASEPIDPTPLDDRTTPTTVEQPAILDLEQSVKLALPTGWRQLNLDAAGARDRLHTAAGVAAEDGDAVAMLSSNFGEESSVATATFAGAGNTAGSIATVTISAIKRNTLTLQAYLRSVEQALVARGIQVHTASLDESLRSDGLPIATLHYTLATQGIDAYQVVAYDAPATKLIIFTFTAPTTRYIELLPRFHEVVHSTEF